MKKSTKKFQPDLGMTQGAGCGVGGRGGRIAGGVWEVFSRSGAKTKGGRRESLRQRTEKEEDGGKGFS